MILRLCIAILIMAQLPSSALAWGAFGHQSTAKIASKNIDQKSAAHIKKLFQSSALLGTYGCQLKSLVDASVWPDCIRRDRVRWGYSAPWHYQNINICEPFNIRSRCVNRNCVSAQVDRNAVLLADKKLPDHIRLEALAFLVHFVGDMYMSLHSGDRNDRGGNDVSAAYGFIEGHTNLHSLWDGLLAERAITDGSNLAVRYDAVKRAQLSKGNTEDWMREAWQVSRDFAYQTAQDKASCGEPLKTRAKVDNDEIKALSLLPDCRYSAQVCALQC